MIAAKRSLMSGSVWDEMRAAPDSLRALVTSLVLLAPAPFMSLSRSSLQQRATMLNDRVDMLLELSAMTRCEQVKPWNQKNSIVSEQHARFTDSELIRRRHPQASCEKDL